MPRTIEIQAYKFDELSETAKQKVLEKFYDLNVDYDWWDFIYEDAKTVGIKITSFGLDRHKDCDGEFYDNAEEVAEKILKEHGESCETHKTAQSFMDDCENLRDTAKKEWEKYLAEHPNEDEREWEDYEEYFGDKYESDFDDLCEEFEKDIFSDYADILQDSYDYLTSEEAIVESIEANKYEFDENGKQI
jgi:hypothetical protein